MKKNIVLAILNPCGEFWILFKKGKIIIMFNIIRVQI